jgi:flagellar biosynthesis protein FliP
MSGLGNAALLGLAALVPLVVLMLTSFVKVSVVLSLLRNALGTSDAPSGLVVTGISLVLTFFVMAPVAIDMVAAASNAAAPAGSPQAPPGRPASPSGGPASPSGGPAAPAGGPASPSGGPAAPAGGPASPSGGPASPGDAGASEGNGAAPGGGWATSPDATGAPSRVPFDVAIRAVIPPAYRGEVDAVERGLGPLRAFLARHAAAADRETFARLAGRGGRVIRGDELWVLAPAFLSTELREAFAMAVLLFIPFLVLDLVVGLGLAALGLGQTSPATVALPLKLLLFVAVDGWRLLLEALLRGYA